MGNILCYFLQKRIFTFFTLKSSLKAQFVVWTLKFQKWFGVDVLEYQIELSCIYFGLFWLGNCLPPQNDNNLGLFC
jgi:hypothetical protein